MRVLVYPHDLGIGGSQLNAIELAAAVRDLGHEVLVFGPRGPLECRISQLDLEFLPAPQPSRRPSASIVSALRHVVVDRRIDVVHGYEWPPILEARLAVLGHQAACVGTVMSMAVAPFIPRQLPLVVGTHQIADAERRGGRGVRVHVIEPPVDLVHNTPSAAGEVEEFRQQHGIPAGPLVVVVTRFAHELKLEGVLTAIDVVPSVDAAAVLCLVGDGPARSAVAEAAEARNRRAGRRAVVLTGELHDPRPAYTAADVVLGMGGSALRAMAFAKPVVIQGEHGFWEVLSPESVDQFLWAGWYGVGESRTSGPAHLRAALGPLLADTARQRALGDFGRDLVVGRFSLTRAAEVQADIYEDAATGMCGARPDPIRDTAAVSRFAVHAARRRSLKLRGRRPSDDFNARPLAAARREAALS